MQRTPSAAAHGLKKARTFSAVFLVAEREADGAHCIASALKLVGATQVTTRVTSTQVSRDLVVATFSCCISSGFKHGPGQEALHRCYAACDALQYAALVPNGDDLFTRDYSSVLPRGVEKPMDDNHLDTTSIDEEGIRSLQIGGEEALRACITVVVTTSPMRCDPELDMLEAAFASLALAGLHVCRQVLICDHKDDGDDAKTSAAGDEAISLKKASLPKQFMMRYRERMAKLRGAPWAANVEIVELDSWHGFALATCRALELVRTPLVMVIQHDLAFLRQIDLRPVSEMLLRSPRATADRRANYVTFPRATQHGYRREMLLRTGLRVGAPVTFHGQTGDVPLTRFPQFLDGTHLARVDWYKQLFRRAQNEPAFSRMVRRGSSRFSQEMTLGPYLIALAKTATQRVAIGTDGTSDRRLRDLLPGERALPSEDEVTLGVHRVCAEFGGWLWDVEDSRGFVIFHLDASRHYAQWEVEEKGLPASQMLTNYHQAVAAQAAGLPVEAILPLVPQTTGKRVLAESGLCQQQQLEAELT